MNPMRLTVLAVALSCGLAFGTSLLRAQEPTSPDRQRPPVFKAGVELVRLDVRVVGENGLPIKDLRADEIQVFEGNVQRPIVLFQHIAEPVGEYAEIARRTIGAEVSTNQGAPRGHLYVFVFDQNHISAGNEFRARQAVERFLRFRVKPGDRVALFGLPGPGPQLPLTANVGLALAELPKVRGSLERRGFTVLGDMTQFEAFQIARGEPETLQRVLNRASEAAAAGLDVSARPSLSAIVSSTAASATSSATPMVQVAKEAARTIVGLADAEARSLLLSLTDAIRDLAKIEGRKTVLLVSEGFFGDNVVHEVERVAAAAAEAYAVVYSLDINRRGPDLSATEPGGAGQAQEIQSRLEPLGTLAADTSGELVIDASSRLESAMNRIAASSQDYYIIGFEPPASAFEDRGRYRRISIRVTRRGASASTRTGYALRDAVATADRRRSIDAALSAPFPQQGLPLEMTTYVLRGTSPGAQRVVLSLRAELPVSTDRTAKPADVIFVTRDARDGRVVASGTDLMPLPRAAAPGRTTADGRFHVQFDLPAGSYLMRVVVREPGGTTGTVDRRFDVRALDGVDIAASDLIIGRRADVLPVRATGYVTEGLLGALEVYARNPSDLARIDVTVDLVPVNGETAVQSVKADLLEVKRVGNGAGRTAQVAIPLEGVPPGEYVARARVRAYGEALADLVRQVDVVAAPPPADEALAAPEHVTPVMILAGDLARRFVASLGSSSTDAAVRAAAEQAGLGAWDKVLALLGEGGTGRPAAFHALRGLALFAAERFELAAVALETALSVDATSAPAAFYLGWARASARQDADALTAWRNAVRLDPALVSAYLAMADTYVRLSHPELAVQVLEAGLKAVPGSVELQARLDVVRRQ